MIKYANEIFSLFFLLILVLYEWYCRKSNQKRIKAYMNRMGGEIIDVQYVSFRNHVYSVSYLINGEKESKTVKFTLTREEIWY